MAIDFRRAALAGIAGTVAFDLAGFLLTGQFWDVPGVYAVVLGAVYHAEQPTGKALEQPA